MQEIYLELIILVIFEWYESTWQKATTLRGILSNIYTRYQQGIFYFLFSHPSFYYLLYLGLKYDLTNFWFLSILFFKFMDISYKLVIVKKIEENALSEVLPAPLDMNISPWMGYINIVLYPALFLLALQN